MQPRATGIAFVPVLVCLGLWTAVRAQTQPQPPTQTQPQAPTFRSSVERVTVDAIVVDGDGNQVRGLTAADFQLTVDDKPRTVESAEFIDIQDSSSGPTSASTSAATEPLPEVSINGRTAAAGRLIVIVADAESYRAGQERAMVNAGLDFVRGLSRRDRVGLLTLPTGLPTVDLTLDHDRVAKALTSVVGQQTGKQGELYVGVYEALQITRGDLAMQQQVIERECRTDARVSASDLTKSCLAEVPREAARIVLETRIDQENKVRMLQRLIDNLSKVGGSKIVVLLSQGIASLAGTTMLDFHAIGQAAGRGAISFYAIQMSPTGPGADDDRLPQGFDFRQEAMFFSEGLRDLASASGGTMIQAAGKLDVAFQRVAREIAGRYVLSFNVEPEDRTGKPRKIDLKIAKSSGRLLRYRTEFVWRAPAAAPATSASAAPTSAETTDATALAAALASSEPRGDLALAVSTFTSPDAQAPGQRTTMWARIGQADARPDASTLAFEVMNEKNVRVASSRQSVLAKPGEPLDFVARMPLPAGRYVLRMAAIDQAGRIGTVEHPFEARLAATGPPAVGSLLLLDSRAMAAGRSTLVRILGPQDTAFHSFVELQAPESFDWRSIKGTLEVLDTASGAVRTSIPMQLRQTKDATRYGLEASVPVRGWAIGTYRIRATITKGDTPLASPIRSIVLDTPPPAAAPEATMASAGDVVSSARLYLDDYLAKGSSVVAEEHYVQIQRAGPPKLSTQNEDRALEWREDNNDKPRDLLDAPRRRQLVSDVLMIKTQDGTWTNYRDVGMVDGRTLGNRSKRAIELFTESGGDAGGGGDLGAKLRKVADESSRYNLAQYGNFNVPTLPMMVLQRDQAGRFEFARQGEEVIDGVPVAIISYRETKAPAFIHNRIGADVFISGRLWIAMNDGRVMRTEMQVSDRLSGWASHSVVSYRVAPSLGVLMPAEMWERHYRIDNFRLPFVEGRARYSSFRTFAVSVSEESKQPK